jgi:superfamily II DNA or RNA helicase
LNRQEVEAIVDEASEFGGFLGIRLVITDEEDDEPWTAPPSRRRKEKPITTHLPDSISLVLGNQIYSALVNDEKRNDIIVTDVLNAINDKRSPIVLTERVQHLTYLADQLSPQVQNVFVFQGGMGAKKIRLLKEQLANLPDSEERLILATGRYLGEGFDDARLDTLFLTLPISWRGTLIQYAGRLHRLHYLKKEVLVYDYVDNDVPVLARMFEKRRRGYKASGYEIEGA